MTMICRPTRLLPLLTHVRAFKQEKANFEPPRLGDKLRFKMAKGNRYSSTELFMAGENMFGTCAEYPEFEQFVEHLKLPDNFQTWFSLTTLHMWMCLLRLRREGNEGRILKRRFVEIFWLDLRPRLRSFRVLSGANKQVQAFRMQFFGSVFAYDEGFLLNSDAALANALWRNLFLSSTDVALSQLDLAVEYTRKNMVHLDGLSSDIMLKSGTPPFLPLIGSELNRDYANRRVQYCVSWPSFVPM